MGGVVPPGSPDHDPLISVFADLEFLGKMSRMGGRVVEVFLKYCRCFLKDTAEQGFEQVQGQVGQGDPCPNPLPTPDGCSYIGARCQQLLTLNPSLSFL